MNSISEYQETIEEGEESFSEGKEDDDDDDDEENDDGDNCNEGSKFTEDGRHENQLEESKNDEKHDEKHVEKQSQEVMEEAVLKLSSLEMFYLSPYLTCGECNSVAFINSSQVKAALIKLQDIATEKEEKLKEGEIAEIDLLTDSESDSDDEEKEEEEEEEEERRR